MRIDIITTYTQFEKLKINWNAVYERDPEAQFFLSWVWLSQVLRQHVDDWSILAVKVENGSSYYVAFFPLYLKTLWSKNKKVFCNEIHMLGRIFWADYTGFICHPDYEQSAIPELATQLQKMHWRTIYLKNISASDQRLDLFIAQFDKDKFFIKNCNNISSIEKNNLLICPYVNLPDDFDTYLTENMSTKTRQKLRRFMRKFEASNTLKISYSTPETYEQDLDILIHFWKKKWAQRKGKNIEELAKKYRKILRQGLLSGTVHLPILWQSNTPKGALASFVDWQKKRLLFFVAGRDELFNTPPPGLLLHAYNIRWAIKNGIKTYDFLRGNERYKYSYGVQENRIQYRILHTTSGVNLNNSLDPTSIKEVLLQTDKHQKSGDLILAETGYQQALHVFPHHITALRRYGKLLYQSKKLPEAEKIYQRLIDNEPKIAEHWGTLGKIQLALHEFTAAESSFRMAIKINTNKTINAYYYLVYTLYKQGLTTDAKTEFNTLLTLTPRNNREQKQQEAVRKQFQNQT